MKTDDKNIAGYLLDDAIFSRGRYSDLSRLISYVSYVTFQDGEKIYSAEESAEYLYLIISGSARIIPPNGREAVLGPGNRLGEESALDFGIYLAETEAVGELNTLRIPRRKLLEFMETNHGLAADFQLSLVNVFSGSNIVLKDIRKRKEYKGHGRSTTRTIGWIVTLVMSILAFFFGHSNGLELNASVFLAIFTSTILMWIFKLMDEYIPGIFAVLATLILGLVPHKVVLSGFTSDGFFMAMSVLALSFVIVASGLSYRFLLLLLKWLPNSQFSYSLGLLLTGFFLTPILPTTNGRVALLKPFFKDMVEILQLRRKGKAASRLAFATFAGVSLISSVFITSKSVNLIIYGLLPKQVQDQFQWLYWFLAAIVTGGILTLFYLITSSLFFRNTEQPSISKSRIREQLKLLGNLKRREWAAVLGIFIFLIGIVSSSVHKIKPPWVGFTILFGLLIIGSIDKKEFREKIDWPFLILLATVVGIINSFNSVGFSETIISTLGPIGYHMNTSFQYFIVLLCGIILLLRLFMPPNAAIILSATVFLPMAELSGINPWLIGFIILVFGEMWFFPYQCSYYIQFQELDPEENVYNEKSFLKYNLLINLLKFGAVFASIPYWRKLGLM